MVFSPLNELRNTPTGVGKTINNPKKTKRYEKHPHGCGEDYLILYVFISFLETPPRVWGRL